MFFSGGNAEPMENAFDKIPGFTDHFVRDASSIHLYNQYVPKRIDAGFKLHPVMSKGTEQQRLAEISGRYAEKSNTLPYYRLPPAAFKVLPPAPQTGFHGPRRTDLRDLPRRRPAGPAGSGRH